MKSRILPAEDTCAQTLVTHRVATQELWQHNFQMIKLYLNSCKIRGFSSSSISLWSGRDSQAVAYETLPSAAYRTPKRVAWNARFVCPWRQRLCKDGACGWANMWIAILMRISSLTVQPSISCKIVCADGLNIGSVNFSFAHGPGVQTFGVRKARRTMGSTKIQNWCCDFESSDAKSVAMKLKWQ